MSIHLVWNAELLKMSWQPTISQKNFQKKSRPCKLIGFESSHLLLLAICLPLIELSYCHVSTPPPAGPDGITLALGPDIPRGAPVISESPEIIHPGRHDASSDSDTSSGTPSDGIGVTNRMGHIRSAVVLWGFLPSAPPRWRYLAGVPNSFPPASGAPFLRTAERGYVQGGLRNRQRNDPRHTLQPHQGSHDLIPRERSSRSFSDGTVGSIERIHQREPTPLVSRNRKSSNSSSQIRADADVDGYGGGAATPSHAYGMSTSTAASEGRGRDTSLRQHRRRLQQIYLGPRILNLNAITLYAGAPSGEVSVSLAGDLKFRLTRDGTVNVGGGFSSSQAVALNPSQGRWRAAVPGEGGQGRPSAATAAWVVVPKFFQCCSWFPSRAYFLGEADTGPSGTTAAGGYYFVMEIGANALSGTVGSSTSQSHAGAVNLPSTAPAVSRTIVSRGDEPLGFAGVEALGQTNALVNFADPRVEQYGQAIAYPFNIFTPWDPVTCTQVLVTGLATTGINLLPLTNRAAATANRTIALPSERFSAAAAAAGRNGTRTPTGLVPFCLQWFNIQTLDDYRAFVQRTSPAYRSDYMDDGYGYSDYYDMTHGTDDQDHGDNTTSHASSRRLAPSPISHTARFAKPDSPPYKASAAEAHIERTTANGSPEAAPSPAPAAAVCNFPASSIAAAAAQPPFPQGASSPTYFRQSQPQAQPQSQPDIVNSHPGLWPAGNDGAEEDDTAGIHPIFVGENRLMDSGDAAAAGGWQEEGTGLIGMLRARNNGALLPPHLQRLLGSSNPPGEGQRQPLLLLGRPAVAAASRVLTDPEVIVGSRRLANTTAHQAVLAAQLLSEGAALRTEAILRVIVRLVNAGSPLTAFMMNTTQAWYDGAARLSNAAVDTAIRRLEEGLPTAVVDELRRRADDMAVKLNAALQSGRQEDIAPGRGDGFRDR